MKITRTVTSVPHGEYDDCTILNVEVREYQNARGKRQAVCFHLEVPTENGTAHLNFSPNYTWSPKGTFFKTLVELDSLPAEGEDLDLGDLVGMTVKIWVEENERDGQVYSNIVKFEKSSSDFDTGSAEDLFQD